MNYNPNLQRLRRPELNQEAGKGKIEKPDAIGNIVWQTRSAAPTEFEIQLGDALQEIFDADIDTLPEIVAELKKRGVQTPDGGAWTEESFQAELNRLGA